MFKGEKVPYEEIMENNKQICTKLYGWNYVESEKDIDYLMETFAGFHDSVLRSINYISGSRKVDEGMMVTDDIRQASILFDSDWSDSIEIVFEGVLSLNLRPAKDNFTSDLFSATIMIKNKTLLFYDDEVSCIQEDYEGTCINALGMRWRTI